jgi:hypothetical protein
MSQIISEIANRNSISLSAFVIGAALAFTPAPAIAEPGENADACAFNSDGDTVRDCRDNCIDIANQEQLDADGDGYGTACDCDYNQDGTVDWVDFGTLTRLAALENWDDVIYTDGFAVTPEHGDHDNNGVVNLSDVEMLLAAFGYSPGPSSAP